MPKVSIGVPVYNGAQSLHECLTVLQNQTLADIEVLIFDNASTDATAEIAKEFAANDPRFKYQRQLETKSAGDNFLDCLAAAQAPYFMWRAHDDLSSLNYAEHLASILDQDRDAILAVSGGTWMDLVANHEKKWVALDTVGTTPFVKLLSQSRWLSSYWWYGMYRTGELRREVERHWHWPLFHFDMIFLVHLVSTGRIACRPGAMFYFRRIAPKHTPYPTDLDTLERMARLGLSRINDNIGKFDLPWHQKMIVRVMFVRMVDRKVVRFKKLLKAKVQPRRAS